MVPFIQGLAQRSPGGSLGLMAVLVSLVSCTYLKAEDNKVALANLPPPVYRTMTQALPGANFTSAVKEQGFEQDVYALTGKTADGRMVRLIIAECGTALAVNTDITTKEVPEKVTQTLDHWMKGFQTSKVVRSVRHGGTSIWYEFDGTNNSG